VSVAAGTVSVASGTTYQKTSSCHNSPYIALG